MLCIRESLGDVLRIDRPSRMHLRIFRSPTQFIENLICVGEVFVIAHLKAMIILISKI